MWFAKTTYFAPKNYRLRGRRYTVITFWQESLLVVLHSTLKIERQDLSISYSSVRLYLNIFSKCFKPGIHTEGLGSLKQKIINVKEFWSERGSKLVRVVTVLQSQTLWSTVAFDTVGVVIIRSYLSLLCAQCGLQWAFKLVCMLMFVGTVRETAASNRQFITACIITSSHGILHLSVLSQRSQRSVLTICNADLEHSNSLLLSWVAENSF